MSQVSVCPGENMVSNAKKMHLRAFNFLIFPGEAPGPSSPSLRRFLPEACSIQVLVSTSRPCPPFSQILDPPLRLLSSNRQHGEYSLSIPPSPLCPSDDSISPRIYHVFSQEKRGNNIHGNHFLQCEHSFGATRTKLAGM